MKMKIIIFQIIGFWVFYFLGFTYAQAQEYVAIITKITGQVRVQQSETGMWQSAKIDMKLFPKDIVKTYTNSTCEMVFIDETIVKIVENTILQVKVPSEKKRAKEKGIIADIKLTIGRIFARVKRAVAKEKGFNVETPAAIIGVRGTLFSIEVVEDGDTLVSVKEGILEILGEETLLILEEGNQVEILMEVMEPEEVKPIQEQEEKQWKEQEEWIKEVEEKVEVVPKEEKVEVVPKEEKEILLPIIEDIVDIGEEIKEILEEVEIIDVINIDETIIDIITEQEIINEQPQDTVGVDEVMKEIEIEEEKIE